MNDKMKVLVAEPMKPCEVREINGLEEMQSIVGGCIQAVYPFRDPVALVCNEDGKNLGLPYNRPLTDDHGLPYDMICGTFFLAGVGEEDFVSLTDEQIRRYKGLYDNVMILTSERPENQAAMPDFAVACRLTFRFVREDQVSVELKDAFAAHVNGIFNQDEALAERTVGDLDVTFQGCYAEVRYTFARQDKDAASAELFSKQCVLDVRDQLEGYGCKIEKIECFAEELEPDYGREQARGRETQEKKRKGNRHDR